MGYLAFRAANSESKAEVIGSTSSGLFLLTPRQRVIFLSHQPFRSPLTITVTVPVDKLKEAHPGMPALLSPERIGIPEVGLEIELSGCQAWTPPAPPKVPGTRPEYRLRLEDTIHEIIQSGEPIGFNPLLIPIFNSQEPDSLPEDLVEILRSIQQLEKILLQDSPQEALVFFQRLLGLGRGLTPSGDDFVMGLLLTLNRWPQIAPIIPGMAELNRLVIDKAYQVTTSISANLIECAAAGHSDERLVSALDGIITGSLPAETCASNLTAYGASSGIDALAGIATALGFSPS